jgi:hypothetical protein
MNAQILKYSTALAILIAPLHAQTTPRRATITGGRGPGSCTIEVSVDHAAEIEVRGDLANLTTVAGQTAYWRGFRCNAPVPSMPHDFRLARVNGRGSVRILQEPRNNRGAAVIHISDPQGGRGNYALDVTWRGTGDGWGSPGPLPPGPLPGHGNVGGTGRAIRMCQEAVTDRLNRDGYDYVTFGRTIPDSNPDRNDWISGVASASRRGDTRRFSFACSMDPRSGRVRFVDLRRR